MTSNWLGQVNEKLIPDRQNSSIKFHKIWFVVVILDNYHESKWTNVLPGLDRGGFWNTFLLQPDFRNSHCPGQLQSIQQRLLQVKEHSCWIESMVYPSVCHYSGAFCVSRDCFWICALTSGTSFVAGFIVFSVLGFLAQVYGVSIEAVAESGTALARLDPACLNNFNGVFHLTSQVQVWSSSSILRQQLWCRCLSSGAFVSSWCWFCWLPTLT